MMNKLYLGDPIFTNKVMKLYAWVIPAIFILMSVLFLVSGAWLTAFCFGLVVMLSLPTLKQFYLKHKVSSLLRLVLGVVLILAAIYSTGVYLS